MDKSKILALAIPLMVSAGMSFEAFASPVTKIEDKMVYVTVSMPPTPIASLVSYYPADADNTDFDLTPLIMDTPDKYVISDNTIEVLQGAKDAIFTVTYRMNPRIEGLLGFTISDNPVTGVSLAGVEGDELTLEVHDILALRTEVTPANSTNKVVSFKIENASAENMANAYSVGGSEKFTELVTYRPGTFDLVLTAVENAAVTRRYHVTVNPLLPDGDTGDYRRNLLAQRRVVHT